MLLLVGPPKADTRTLLNSGFLLGIVVRFRRPTRRTACSLALVMRCGLLAGPAGQIAVRLRIGPPVVVLDAGGENPRRRDANRAKHQCGNQRGREIANHVKLLISPRQARRTGWSSGW